MDSDLELCQGCLHHCLEFPNNSALCKQVFFAQPKLIESNIWRYTALLNMIFLSLKNSLRAVMAMTSAMVSTRESLTAKRQPKNCRPKRVPIKTIKKVAEGDLTIKTIMNIDLTIEKTMMTVKTQL